MNRTYILMNRTQKFSNKDWLKANFRDNFFVSIILMCKTHAEYQEHNIKVISLRIYTIYKSLK